MRGYFQRLERNEYRPPPTLAADDLVAAGRGI